jgi:hypothetical protein
MGDREDAKLVAWRGAATDVPRNARPQSGGLVGARPGKPRKLAAVGGHSYRMANRAARAHQTENRRYFSGKMTRAANTRDEPTADLADGQARGEACNV